MGFTLDNIVPWGRSFDEYVAMFALAGEDLDRPIIGCGDGPAAFNAELSRRGGAVVSVDPIYAFETAQIRARVHETYDTVLAQLRTNRESYVWNTIASVEDLGRLRMSAMDAFLSDYDRGKREGRYRVGELPSLPFEDRSFAIALSSHLLFLYSGQLSAEFHVQAIGEMLRVAGEARVFPVLTLDGANSPHLDSVMRRFEQQGFGVELRRVAYEFQKGGNQMLRVWSDP